MGLEEKRLLKRVQEEQLPQTRAQIKEVCGVDIPVEIDRDSFMNDQWAKDAFENLKQSGLDVMVEAVKGVCKDDMGKDAVKEGLKKIVFKQLPNERQNDLKASMKDGVVTVESHFSGPAYVTSSEIQRIIERGL